MSFRASDSPTWLAGNSEFAVATWGPALITLWRGEPTVARALQLEHACVQAFADPGVDLFLQIIEASSPVPNADARTISARVTKNHIHRLRAAAHVVEGDSFRVHLVRTVLRGMTLLVKSELAQKFCEDDHSAARWLAESVYPGDAGGARERLRAGLVFATSWIREQVNLAKKSDSLRPSSLPPSLGRLASELPPPSSRRGWSEPPPSLGRLASELPPPSSRRGWSEPPPSLGRLASEPPPSSRRGWSEPPPSSRQAVSEPPSSRRSVSELPPPLSALPPLRFERS